MAKLKQYGINNISSDDILYENEILTDVIDNMFRTVVKTYNIGNPIKTDVVATLYDDGLLNIVGTGNPDYKVYYQTPWRDDGNYKKIKSVKLGSGIIGNLSDLFRGCSNLTDISKLVIPNGVINIEGMFAECTSLEDISTLVIPDGVYSLKALFLSCTSLKIAAFRIPYDSDTINLFYGCHSLTDVSNLIIPDSMGDMSYMFMNCYSLTGHLKLDTTAYKFDQIFYWCSTNPGTQLIVDYGPWTDLDVLAEMIATKTADSNVIMGSEVD